MTICHTYHNGAFERHERPVVEEFPLVLHVNGREMATLIASPHDLRFLVAGFLRLQGFVERVEDFHVLSVCEDVGVANVRIRGEIPERLKPVLTSGCGTGITFNLPAAAQFAVDGTASVDPEAVFILADALAKRTEGYRAHGGIHSAAVGEKDGTLVLFAEDIGRHNTLDRIAGEALLKKIDLRGKLLVTSGRISSEMAAKASLLGLLLIASRTSPTDKAVQLCEQAGITLVGYVRGGKYTVYAGCERLVLGAPAVDDAACQRIPGVTGVILAGGSSSRMGSNKALLPYGNATLIETLHRQLDRLFDEVIVVTNSPEEYAFLPCRKVPDLSAERGVLAGIHAGAVQASCDKVFVVACDMPFLNPHLIRHMVSMAGSRDAVIPCSATGCEPLHALYTRAAVKKLEEFLVSGPRKMMEVIGLLNTSLVSSEDVARFDPAYRSFLNINTPEEYSRLVEACGQGEGGAIESP
ncbi:formate dehydrogenase accessory sulfurtransferase FdhD [Geobacter sp. DSM 9736]|uniref:formate dehydrogenase accessory sulfurtransferase FdhD n=1 Tax=Geobacter sp. DSM 9736 TaxID=1277350 RepID=UPI000B50BEAD|nr:formate dehydrogenase accessory sulfurtransferase FdhD [Geobacter sp. DSM 9736]SNB46005.1 FdhD protein [Geobacter sp. DSM 9736]